MMYNKVGDKMVEKVISILKDSSWNVPKELILNYKKMDIDEKSLIVLIYLLNSKDCIYNPKKICDDLSMDMNEVLVIVNTLKEKEFISLKFRKIEKFREECIEIDKLYEKIAYKMLDEEEKEVSNKLFEVFEKEFGRNLSPMEYEILSKWQESGFSDEIIELALSEAVYNGVFNFRYIDKILFEWKKKNINSKEDLDKVSNKVKNDEETDTELIDYDWLNED